MADGNRNGVSNVRKAMKAVAVLLVLCMAFGITGCGKKTMSEKEYNELAEKQAERNKNKIAVRVTVGNETHELSLYDLVYYLAYQEQSAMEIKKTQDPYYSMMYGEEYNFWDVADSNGTKMSDGYKDMAFSSAIYTYIFYYEALNAGMTMDEMYRSTVTARTKEFLARYSPEQRAKCGMTEACIRENYEKVFLADQYIRQMTESFKVDEEEVRKSVNKEQYRVYQTDYLFVSKYGYDESYRKVEYSAEESAARKQAIEDAAERTKNGEDMKQIRASYDQFMSFGTRDFYAEENSIEQIYADTVKEMKVGESCLLDTGSNYYVIYLTDNTLYNGYEEAVQQAIESARNVGIADVYTAVEGKYDFAKTEEWDAVKMGEFTGIK